MSTKVQKWGNSLAVRLPKNLVERCRLRRGTGVEVFSEKNRIIIKRLDKEGARLKDLAGRINSQNRHQAEDWGFSVGGEIW